MIRICFLTNNTDPNNGWGRYASDLIFGMKKLGNDVTILKERNDGFDGIPILKRGYKIFFSAIKVIPYLKNCDIIHALDVYPFGVIAFLANIFLGKKLILTAQGTYSIAPFYNWKTKWLSKKTVNSAERIIAISNFTKKEIGKFVSDRKIKVINHGIDLSRFQTEHQNTDEKFILSVGTLKYRKGYHISIPAFAKAMENIRGLKYKIVGSQSDFGYVSKLNKIIEANKIEKEVEFITGISDEELRDLYRKASLFILTSINQGYHFEGFGLVFLEAAAAGLPVIGTSGNGIEDAIKNGHNGLLVPQNDINKTAEAITEILSDEPKYNNMSEKSYKWAREHDSKKVIEQYIKVYERI